MTATQDAEQNGHWNRQASQVLSYYITFHIRPPYARERATVRLYVTQSALGILGATRSLK